MKKSIALLFVVALVSVCLILPTQNARAGDAKQKLERVLIGQWKNPKNKYKHQISIDFTANRQFEFIQQAHKKEAVTWSGNWKVRTTSGGAALAYLKARSQSDPEKYLKAVIRSDPEMENFGIRITFDFKGADKADWQFKLKRASDEDGEKEGLEDEDEDFEDEDEDFEDEDEDLEDEDEDLEDEDEDFEDEDEEE